MVRKKSWEYSVSLELFSSTLRTILRKTRILLGQCAIILAKWLIINNNDDDNDNDIVDNMRTVMMMV